MAWNLPDLPTAGVTIATVANWATKVIDCFNFLKGNAGTVTLGDGLNLGANELTINSIEIVGVDGEVNKAAVEDHTHADVANCGTVAHSALTGLTAGDDHTQYVQESLLTGQGAIPYATAASTWTELAKGTAAQFLRMNAGATAPIWGAGSVLIKNKQETRNATAASGDVSYTGYGFQTTVIVIFADVSGSGSIGISGFCLWYDAGADATRPSSGYIVYCGAASNSQKASLKSADADGFTLTWTKTGSPIGTINMNVIAFGV